MGAQRSSEGIEILFIWERLWAFQYYFLGKDAPFAVLD